MVSCLVALRAEISFTSDKLITILRTVSQISMSKEEYDIFRACLCDLQMAHKSPTSL